MLRRARKAGASDVHLDPLPDGITVHQRVDGVLMPVGDPVRGPLAARVVGRLKAMASLLAYRTDTPQDGVLRHGEGGAMVDVRVATFPTPWGERVALRFPRRGVAPTIEALGFSAATEQGLRDLLQHPEGVLLVTGPSGSGKTTTLYSCLQHLATAQRPRSLVSIEDPIEQHVPGVVQTQVDVASGITTSVALRSLLRQDPDVLLVGEIRDRETASTALEAGLTGHLVISTIHAGTAPMVFARLLDLGTEPFVMTSVIRGVLAQRLVRARCGSRPQDAPCSGERTCACEGTGLRGRAPVDQWLPMGADLRRAVLAREDGEALDRVARLAGMPSLRERADQLVGEGITTQQEVERVLGHR